MRRGQSLVVWAIFEGREAARAIDVFLGNTVTQLEGKDREYYHSLNSFNS